MKSSSLPGKYAWSSGSPETGQPRAGFLPLVWILLFTLIIPGKTRGQASDVVEERKGQLALVESLAASGQLKAAAFFLDHMADAAFKDLPPDSAFLADILFLQGNIALLGGDAAAGRQCYGKARTYATDLLQLSRIDRNTGTAWFSEGAYGRAVLWFSHALAELNQSGIDIKSRRITLCDDLGSASYELGDLDEAQYWWEKAASTAETVFPLDSAALAGLSYHAGLVCLAGEDWAAAIRQFRRAMALNPRRAYTGDPLDLMVRRNLSLALMKDGRIGEAWILLDGSMTEINGGTSNGFTVLPEMLRMKAWLYSASGGQTEADSLLRLALGSLGESVPEGDRNIRLERYRIVRDMAFQRSLADLRSGRSGPDENGERYPEYIRAFGLLRDLAGPDGVLPDDVLLHDSTDVLVSGLLESGFPLLTQQPALAGEMLDACSFIEIRSRRADGREEYGGDSLAREWRRLNRQLYMLRKTMGQGTAEASFQNPGTEQERFVMRNEYDSISDRLQQRPTGNEPALTTESRLPDYLAERLSAGEAVLDYLITPAWVYIFIVRTDGVRLVRGPAGDFFVNSLSNLQTALSSADDRHFHRLCPEISSALLQPALPFLDDVRRLYIVPSRDLEGIPFECLLTGSSEYLVERFAVSYHLSLEEVVPDATSGTVKDPVDMGQACDFLGFSPGAGEDPVMEPILHASDEVSEIGKLFRSAGLRACLFTGSDADEEALLREIGSGRIVHIATHARTVEDRPEESGLHFWKHFPAVTNDSLIDGILELGELNSIRFKCDLLALSSCNIGKFEWGAGRGGMNLRGEFLDAGAGRLLHSLWNVSDRHTRTLMRSFYNYYLGGFSYAEALRRARLDMMKNPATSSPFFWAAFILTCK